MKVWVYSEWSSVNNEFQLEIWPGKPNLHSPYEFQFPPKAREMEKREVITSLFKELVLKALQQSNVKFVGHTRV